MITVLCFGQLLVFGTLASFSLLPTHKDKAGWESKQTAVNASRAASCVAGKPELDLATGILTLLVDTLDIFIGNILSSTSNKPFKRVFSLIPFY